MSIIKPVPHSDRVSGPYTATGGQVDFAGTFYIQNDFDIEVTRKRGVAQPTLVLDTDYEVIGVDISSGFTVRLLVPALAGDVISIQGLATLDRLTSIVQAGQFNSRAVDREFDRNRIIDQELRRDVDAVASRVSDVENGLEFSEDFAAEMQALLADTEDARDVAVSAAATVSVDAAAVADAKEAAEAAAVAADLSADVASIASLASGYYPAAQANVPRGIVGTSGLTAGSGGANGTFALAFSGGNFAVNPVGTFTVAGGALTAVTITSPGLYVGASPTAPAPSFAASAGLTGAAITLTVDFLVQAGKYYWTDHATDTNLLAAYYRSGSAAVASSPLVTLPKSAPASYGLFTDLFFRNSAAQGKPLTTRGKDCLIGDGVKTWVPNYRHGYGEGAYKIAGTGSVAKFTVWFDGGGAEAAGVTVGSSLLAGAVVVAPAGLDVAMAGRFVDVDGVYVGGQVGTLIGQIGTGEAQFIKGAGVVVPSGAAGFEIWAFSSTTEFYVLDVTCVPGADVETSLRLKASLAFQIKGLEIAQAAYKAARAAAPWRDVVTPAVGDAGCSNVSSITVSSRTPRTEADGFTGFGQTFTTPGSLSRNAFYFPEIQRGSFTNPEKRWTRIKAILRTHATDASLAAATVVAIGEVAVNPENATLQNVLIPMRSPTTGQLITVTHTDLLAQYAIIFEALTDDGKAYTGEAHGTVNVSDGAKVASYYTTAQDAEAALWATYSGNPTLAMGLATLTSPVVTRVYDLGQQLLAGFTVPKEPARRLVSRMRRFRVWSAKKKLGETPGKFNFAFVGDSWTCNSDYFLSHIVPLLNAEYGHGGVGWFGFGSVSTFAAANSDARGLYYPKANSGTWTFNYHAGSTSPDICDARSSVAASSLTIASISGATHPALSGVKLHFTGTADGVIRWRWNGGAWSGNTNVQGGVGVQQTLDLTGFPTGALVAAALDAITLQIEVVSGSVILCGVDLQSTAEGLVLHKLGASGATATSWLASNATQWQAGLAALGASAVQIMLGVNDQAASVGASLFASQIGDLIDRCRSAVPQVDVLVTSPPETPAGYSVKIPDYARALPAVCDTKTAAMLDLQPVFGDANDPDSYDSASAFPMFAGDNAHPGADGKKAIGRELFLTLTAA